MGKASSNTAAKGTGKGLGFQRYFTKAGVDVYDLFNYEKRTSVIRNPAGDAVFEMKNVEVPNRLRTEWPTVGKLGASVTTILQAKKMLMYFMMNWFIP